MKNIIIWITERCNMKNLLFSSLAILLLATALQAQDTASVTFIPATGNYLLQYTVNGIQYADTLEPSTKIDPTVSCTITFDATAGLYNYVYTVGLLPSSQQYLLSFSVAHTAEILLPLKPNATWMMLAWNQQLWSWSNSLVNPSGLRPDTTNIAPGESLGGFSFRSTGLPTIVKAYFSGNAVSLAFTGEPPSLMQELLAPLRVFPNDQVIKSTLGPTNPPTPFNGLTFLDTLISYKHQAVTLGWLKSKRDGDCDDDEKPDDGIVGNLDKRLEKAKKELIKGDSVKARKELEKFVKKVERLRKRSEEAENKNKSDQVDMTSEAYALLKYNAEYLIDRLPDRKPKKGSKEKD